MFLNNAFPFQFDEISANIMSAIINVGFSVAYTQVVNQTEKVFDTTQLKMIIRVLDGQEMAQQKFEDANITIFGPDEVFTYPGVRFQAVVSKIFISLGPTVEKSALKL